MGQFSWMYGAAWQQARADYLKRHPFCAICGKPLRGAGDSVAVPVHRPDMPRAGRPRPALLRKALHRINHAAEQKAEEALDIIDKPEPKKDDGAFRKF